MDLNEIERLTKKIELKQNSALDIDREAAALMNELKAKSQKSDSLSSALGLNADAKGSLDGYIGTAKNFPLLDLEKTIEFGLHHAQLLKHELENPGEETDSLTQKSLIDAIACAQWHFNEVSKALTSEYRTTEKVTSYSMISPLMGVDTDMALNEISCYEKVAEETKKVLAQKDLKALYKCNADIMTISTNITQYRYCALI